MNNIKFLMNKLIEKHGGEIIRINQRTYWVSQKGDKYHLSTVFLKRMVSLPPTIQPQQQESVDVNIQPTKEIILDEPPELQSEPKTPETTPEAEKKTEEEGIPAETPKKKKKSGKKNPKPKMETETEQSQKDTIADSQ
jgi:outer membrane biosynthesis protein TonB